MARSPGKLIPAAALTSGRDDLAVQLGGQHRGARCQRDPLRADVELNELAREAIDALTSLSRGTT